MRVRPIAPLAGALLLVVGLARCSGGADPVQPPPPPPPPPPDNTRNLAVHEGDNQQAFTGQTVAVRPAVRVVNSGGTGVAGVAVTFTVASGGGSVTGATPTTDANGVAAVGNWTLGPNPGANTLSVSAQGQTSGPVTITATGVEFIIEPSQDTSLSGTIKPKQVTIPAGITVTVTGTLLLESEGDITVAGTMQGNCVGITLDAAGDLTISGTVDNGCTVLPDDPPALLLIGRGGYELTPESEIVASGDVEVTNDPTLTDADFPPLDDPEEGPVFVALGRTTALSHDACKDGGTRSWKDPRAKDGAPGKDGGDGQRGRRLFVSCRGNAIMDRLTILGQGGGHGGKGTDNSTPNASATGGNGGRGGEIRIRSTGSLTFSGDNTIKTGDGGDGGAADAMPPMANGSGRAPDATAVGGIGRAPGLFRVVAGGSIVIPVAPLNHQEFTIGKAGNGGKATAVAADGMDAGANAAQAGGHGSATGGAGGSTPDKQLSGSSVVGQSGVVLAGGDAGEGGVGDATGGKGGNGNRQHPHGARGGDITAKGGKGGNANLRDINGIRIGTPGKGGDAFLRRGVGGNGYVDCVPPLVPGGNGGRGGDGSGGAGVGGMRGDVQAPSGTTLVRDEAGNGGKAGDGLGPGTRGARGAEVGLAGAPNRVDTEPVFELGAPGSPCGFQTTWVVHSDPLNHESVLQLTTGEVLVRLFSASGTSTAMMFQFPQGSGSASGSLTQPCAFTLTGSWSMNTPFGTRSGTFQIQGVCDPETGTITMQVTMHPTGQASPVVYNVTATVIPPAAPPAPSGGSRR